jgi:hypothetical protein
MGSDMNETKETRIWYLVVALCSVASLFRLVSAFMKDVTLLNEGNWAIMVVTLFGVFVTGTMVTGVGTFLQGKAEVAKTVAEKDRLVAEAVAKGALRQTETAAQRAPVQ